MKKIKCLLLILLIVTAPQVFSAPIGIRLRLNRMVYMQHEPIYACVTLRNDTGRALLFGKDPRFQGFVLFDIRDSENRRVPQKPDAEISVTGMVLAPGEIKNMIIPLQKYYRLDRCGSYRISAFVSHNLLHDEYESDEQPIRIESGVPVWSRTVGLPDLDGDSKDEIKMRTYSIRSLTESTSKYYYLVVEDEGNIYSVLRVGQMVGREKFQAEIDMLSRIHLLMPLSPRVFHYLAFSLDGINVANSYWRISDTIPMLYRDPANGMVTRMGGVQARPGVDFQDPNAGKLTASKLLNEEEKFQEQFRKPLPYKDQGLVDLGKKLDLPVEKKDE